MVRGVGMRVLSAALRWNVQLWSFVCILFGLVVDRCDDGVAGDVVARELADDSAGSHDEYSVADSREVIRLDRRDEHCSSGVGFASQRPQDVIASAHVDRLGWLVGDKDPRGVEHPLREKQLLLVPSAE